jgi:DNA-binding Lrp family transcriptional regulator
MDEIDKQILQILQDNCKVNYQKIASKLKLAASTVHARVKKMLQLGVIKHFSAIVEPEKAGYSTTAWIGLSADPRKMEEVAKKLAAFDEIQIVCTASGAHDLLVQAVARNDKELWRFINKKIKTMPGIEKDFDVSSFLDVYKRSSIISL